MADNDLDVRQLRMPDNHPTIFAGYDDPPVGGPFVLVNSHDEVLSVTSGPWLVS